MKSIIYKFDPVIYPFPLLVSKDFDIQELRDRFYYVLNKEDVKEITDELNANPTSVARTILLVEKNTGNVFICVFIYKPNKINVGFIAHEALHANTLNGFLLGITPPSIEDDEPQAYFVQWVANCIESVLKGRPEKNNGLLWMKQDNAST